MALTVTGVQRSRPSLYDITDQLRRITAPTLVVNGDEDGACLEPGLLLKPRIPTAELLIGQLGAASTWRSRTATTT